MKKEQKKLTEMTTAGGWAAKIGPEVLHQFYLNCLKMII